MKVRELILKDINIKCRMERISALKIESIFGEPCVWRGERTWKKEKVKYLDKIPVSGKTQKTLEKSKK